MKHTLFMLLKFVGLRDRLRCPNCKAVGTWKPHGGWLDREDVRGVRRWLCKWCGYYLGPEQGRETASIEPTAQAWGFSSKGTTPQKELKASKIPNAWPWRG